MTAQELSIEIAGRLNLRLRISGQRSVPFIFHVLGPPSIGKTFLQEQLFLRWEYRKATFLQVSSFAFSRHGRLRRCLSECAANAYHLQRLRSALTALTRGRSVTVRIYDHLLGATCQEAMIVLRPSRLIYLEGPIWLHCSDIVSPDFTVIMLPLSLENWHAAYVHRNTRYRNYSIEQAETAFELAHQGWRDSLRLFSGRADFTVHTDLTGPDYVPSYFIVSKSSKNEANHE